MSDQLSDLFPDQIILEILTRLPAKAISRFRSVSKAWNFFITEPHFLTTYLSRNPPTWFTLDRIIHCSVDPSETDPIRFIPSPYSGVVDLTINPNLLLKPDEPLSDPDSAGVVTPAEILHSSNGLVLLALNVNPDPLKDGVEAFANLPFSCMSDTRLGGPGRRQNTIVFSRSAVYDVFFVTNPTTREWARLPRSPNSRDWRYEIMLVTRPGPVGEFVVGAFARDLVTGGCTLSCYGSETGKWVNKDVGNPLGSRSWLSFSRFEYQGKMCWSDTRVGIIIWEEDPFVGCVNEKKGKCRFIPIPPGRALEKDAAKSMMKRCVDGAGEWIQYTELSSSVVEVWRLKGYGKKSKKEGKWHLVYKVPRVVLVPFLGSEKSSFWSVSFVDPLDTDVVIMSGEDTILSLDVRNRVVKNSGSFICHNVPMPCVVPSWPPSLPPRHYSEYIKEQGNACFKVQNFNEAMKCYSTSIALSPSVVAYGNRALSYIALGRFYEAEQDCTEALKLDHKFFKAYGRRALAREKLGNLKGALEDVEFASKLQPDNKLMKERYDDLKCSVDKVNLVIEAQPVSSICIRSSVQAEFLWRKKMLRAEYCK